MTRSQASDVIDAAIDKRKDNQEPDFSFPNMEHAKKAHLGRSHASCACSLQDATVVRQCSRSLTSCEWLLNEFCSDGIGRWVITNVTFVIFEGYSGAICLQCFM